MKLICALIMLSLLTAFSLAQTPNGSRKAWIDSLLYSHNSSYVPLHAVFQARDTSEAKLIRLDSIGSMINIRKSGAGANGLYVLSDSTYPENGFFAFNTPAAGKQLVNYNLYMNRPHFAADYGVVVNDSTYSATNTSILNALFLAAYQNANFLARGNVVLPRGIIWVERASGKNYCLNIQYGIVIDGAGPSVQNQGTMIKMRAGQTTSSSDTIHVVVNGPAATYLSGGSISPLWWHESGLRNLAINGQSASNSGYVTGLTIARPGEASFVENLWVGQWRGWGVRVHSISAPHLRISSVSSFPGAYKTASDTTVDFSISPRKSFWFSNGASINGNNLSGDNGRPLVYIGSGGKGASAGAHIKIDHLKYESGNSSSPGYTVSVPIVIDSVSNIGSSVRIDDLSANRGDNFAAGGRQVVYIRGPNIATHLPLVEIGIAQAGKYQNIARWEFPGQVDSVSRFDNVDGDAAQTGGFYRIAYANNIYERNSTAKEFGAGVLLQNYNQYWVKSYYVQGTGSQLNIKLPTDSLLIETKFGTDLATVDSTNGMILKRPLFLDAMYLQMEEQPAPSAPSANHGRMYLQADGSGNTMLLIKFANGDVDTLATDQ